MKQALKILMTACILLSLAASHSFADRITFGSDGTWKAYTVYQEGWETADFDDSSWWNAYDYYIGWHGSIWSYPGSVLAFFRKTITLDDPVISAIFGFAVNDELDLYVNGIYAYGERSGGANSGYSYLPPSLFKEGENTIAIFAFDGGWYPYDRCEEWLAFGFDIQTTPEPSTIILLGIGLLGIYAKRRMI